MARLKEDETIIVVGEDHPSDIRFAGVYRRDTRFLSRFAWDHPALELLRSALVENRLIEHHAAVTRTRTQLLDMRRELSALKDGLRDCWTITNVSTEPQDVRMALEVEPDFGDLFARLLGNEAPTREIKESRFAQGRSYSAEALDGVSLEIEIGFEGADEDLVWQRTFAPGEQCTLCAEVRLRCGDDPSGWPDLPSFAQWREAFAGIERKNGSHGAALSRAVDDLKMLLLATQFGPYPAAGMPWFGNKFGRDALITATMLLPWVPELTASVLRLLAHHQGASDDPFREEQPGKILHEIRAGELSRTDRIPFARYYGSVDATALFVMTLAAHEKTVDNFDLTGELADNLTRALDWLIARQEGGDDLIHFEASGSGLVVQSWKDSHDSMNHADGSAAAQPLAVAEVQGYAYAAFIEGADLLDSLGQQNKASDLRRRAEALARSFHARYWLEDLETYAMALDGEGKPLAVLSSDPGHLLWCGIVPADIAGRLVATMMSPPLWSGWGLRTLGDGEARYAPASYHNGSVWPHDTALFGLGLARYGFQKELGIVTHALFDLAAAMPHHRIPELISGHPREPGLGPVHYGNASAPQAWAAAALPALAHAVAGLETQANRA